MYMPGRHLNLTFFLSGKWPRRVSRPLGLLFQFTNVWDNAKHFKLLGSAESNSLYKRLKQTYPCCMHGVYESKHPWQCVYTPGVTPGEDMTHPALSYLWREIENFRRSFYNWHNMYDEGQMKLLLSNHLHHQWSRHDQCPKALPAHPVGCKCTAKNDISGFLLHVTLVVLTQRHQLHVHKIYMTSIVPRLCS